jgi:hypothetical protein
MAVADEGSLMIFGNKADALLIELDDHIPFNILFPFLLGAMGRTA